MPLERIAETLSDFGLTPNQSKVYITIAKLGIASVGQVSKASKVRREDVYRILPKLQRMGLAERLIGKPAKVRAVPVDNALSILIRRERDLAKKRLSRLMSKREDFLKKFDVFEMKPIDVEKAHFAMISQREAIIERGLTMVKEAKKDISIVMSSYEFNQLFINNIKSVKKAISRGVKVRVILEISERDDSIHSIVEEYKSKAPFDLKYSYQISSHFIIVDYERALISTSMEPLIGHNPYLWTDNKNLIELIQRYFEDMWHTSVNQEAVVINEASDQALHLVSQLKPTNHVVFFYESPEVKHKILFNYIKNGLEKGEATTYVASEEDPSQIREAMERFGIEVESHEKTGALRILESNDFYIINGKFNAEITISLIRKMYAEALAKEFKGWRITGEMACFFEHDLIKELIEYERSLHRVFDFPIIAVCAYNAKSLNKVGNPINLYSELVAAHGTVIFTGIDNKLGRIEIRKA